MDESKSWLDELEKELNAKETYIVEMAVTLTSVLNEDKHQIIFQGRTQDGTFSELKYDMNCELFASIYGSLNQLVTVLEMNKRLGEGS